MKNRWSILLDNYFSINYILVFAFIVVNFIAGREFRDIISFCFTIVMMPLLVLKIVNEVKNEDDVYSKNSSGFIIRDLLIFGTMLGLFFFLI